MSIVGRTLSIVLLPLGGLLRLIGWPSGRRKAPAQQSRHPAGDDRQLWKAVEERRSRHATSEQLWEEIKRRHAHQETPGAAAEPGEALGEADVLPPSLQAFMSQTKLSEAQPRRATAIKRSRFAGVSGRALVPVVLVVALAVAAGGLAFFTASGSGLGLATDGSAQSVTISPATPTTALYPGGVADVAATITNPNPFAAHLPSLELDTGQGTGGFSVDAGHSGCDLSSLSFTTQTNGGGDFVVPAAVGATDGMLSVDLAGAISMTTTAPNACQGATFTVYLKVGP